MRGMLSVSLTSHSLYNVLLSMQLAAQRKTVREAKPTLLLEQSSFALPLITGNQFFLNISLRVFEGRMEGKKKTGRPRMVLLDRMMKEDYSKLREIYRYQYRVIGEYTKRAGHPGEWCQWTYTSLPMKGREPRRSKD